MKFIINKEELIEGLQKVLGPTTSKQSLPLLSSVLLSTVDNKIKFTATDLDITVVAFQEAKILQPGQIAIPMKRFLSIARELPSQEITVEKTKNSLWIRCEKIEFKVNTLNPEEFPQVQEGKGVSLIRVDPAGLEDMLDLTSFCVGYEDVNYVLSGILFELQGNKMNLVATDGKRLSYIQKTLPPNQSEIASKMSFILPIKAVNELNRLIKGSNEETYLFVEENRVGLDFKDTQFIARPIEGEFPNYSQYIPGGSKDRLEVDRKKLLYALRRASLLSTPDYQGVKLEIKKDSINISKTTPQLGEVKESLEAQYTGSNMEIGFNPNYLIDVLKNLDDENVNIDFFGSDKPMVLRKEGYVYLLLPLKA